MKHKQLGFTLIELMITVAIVGILATIAIPSYQDSVKKSRRADVKGVLLGLANAMERHFTNNNSYCDVGGGTGTAVTGCGTADLDTGTPDPAKISFTIPTETAKYYTVTISSLDAASYTLSAVPTGGQAGDKCDTLTLRHTGEKNNSAGLPLSDCW